MKTVLRDWPMQAMVYKNTIRTNIKVQKIGDIYERQSAWLSNKVGYRDPVDAVCDLIVDLIHAFVARNANYLCLHGAALEAKNGLTVFPNSYRAGKSLLSVKMVSCGARLFGDDALPIHPLHNYGVALGILPRLRLPLPQSVGNTFQEFITKRSGPRNNRYWYIRLNENEMVRRGTLAPVKNVIILNRNPQKTAALVPASKSDAVKSLILRNFARQNQAIQILDRLYAIVNQADCYTLTYKTLDQAAEILNETFEFNSL